jgi:hypothetical protein
MRLGFTYLAAMASVSTGLLFQNHNAGTYIEGRYGRDRRSARCSAGANRTTGTSRRPCCGQRRQWSSSHPLERWLRAAGSREFGP